MSNKLILGLAAALFLPLLAVSSARASGTGLVFVSNERSSEIFVLDKTDTVVSSFRAAGVRAA